MAPIKKRSSIRARASNSTHAAKSTRDAISHPNSTQLPVITTASPDQDQIQTDTTALRPNKKQKSQLRHANLLQKVRDGGISKRGVSSDGGLTKRRRPGKKIAAVEGLAGLRDALPDLEGDDEWEGLSDTGTDDEMGDGAAQDENGTDGALPTGMREAKRRRGTGAGGDGQGKVVMKSLRHRPGAMKRKRALELRETERMRGNLVQMAQRRTGGADGGGESVSVGGSGGEGADGKGASQAERWKALRAFIGGTMETSGEFGGKK